MTSISTKKLKFQDIVFGNFQAELNTPGNLEINSSSGESSWKLSDGNWVVSGFSLSMDDFSMHSNALELNLRELSENNTNLNFNIGETGIVFDQTEALFSNLSGNIELDGHELEVRGEFGLPKLPPAFTYFTQINLEKQRGRYYIKQGEPLNIANHPSPFNNLIANWAPDLTLVQGSFTISADGHWQNSIDIQSEIQLGLTNASGSYAGVGFFGLDFIGPVFFPPNNHSGSARINIQNLEYGVEVNNIESRFRLNASETNELPGVYVYSLVGEFLGSKFESHDFAFDPNASKNHIEVSLTGLDIGKVVSMQQIDGLSVTGKLDGTLPIDIYSDGLSITLGKFWNQEGGGTIKYLIDPAQAASLSNPLTDTVIKALEEFHYDLLTASTNFQPDGELTINFHIEGKSPKLDNNRPVHLNINSEQNVLSLLESLKYTDELNSELDDNIRKNILSSGIVDKTTKGN